MAPAWASSEDGASQAEVKTKGHNSNVHSVRVLCDLGLVTFPAWPRFSLICEVQRMQKQLEIGGGLWDDSLSEVGKPCGPQTGGYAVLPPGAAGPPVSSIPRWGLSLAPGWHWTAKQS